MKEMIPIVAIVQTAETRKRMLPRPHMDLGVPPMRLFLSTLYLAVTGNVRQVFKFSGFSL
jgi:hypothetical protein